MTERACTSKFAKNRLREPMLATLCTALDGLVLILIPSPLMVCVEIVLVLCTVFLWCAYFYERGALRAESNQMNQKSGPDTD
jgi:hypothetical protein